MKHAGTQTIETQRLILRRLKPTDSEMMFRNWTSDPEVTRFLRWEAHQSLDETRRLLQQWLGRYAAEDTYYWAITLKDGEMIGSIGVEISSECDLRGSLGYKIGSRWWNQGYASEATRAVIDYLFQCTDVERLDAFHSVHNRASGCVMEKAGMQYEGLLRNYYRTRDGFHDCALYAVIRSDWEKMNGLR
ncbi:MAG: GNAT family N-acetyltransferase [Clostridiales bacterium]|nr:GNAT family N-acetyltransferase [Clostridiales bacterium]